MKRCVINKKQLSIHMVIVLMIATMFKSCEKAAEAYIGMPLQPKNIDAEYKPGLNIFGILKTGPDYDTINHFFEVERINSFFDINDTININDAVVSVWYVDSTGNPVNYSLKPIYDGRYTNDYLDPKPGEIWNYKCRYDTFLITSKTIIPNVPALVPGTLNIKDKEVGFSILSDTTGFMYDVYLLSDAGTAYKRITPERGKSTEVQIDMDLRMASQSQLFVFAYDKNYERYVSTSNIFFKPNAFRPRFTTVDGGYGCFCSSSSLMVQIQ